MKKSFVSLLFSVIAGIAVGLTITLRLWGPEWYKVIVAVLAGIVGGLVTNDPKEFIQIIRQAFQESLDATARLPYLGKKLMVLYTQKMPDIEIAVTRLLFRFALMVTMFVFYVVVIGAIVGAPFYLGLVIFNFNDPETPLFIAVCILGLGLSLIFTAFVSSEVNVWRNALSDKENNRIWKGKLEWRSVGYIRDSVVSGYFWEVVYENCSYAEIFSGIMLTVMWVYFRALWRLVKNIFGLAMFLPIWILLLVIDTIVTIFMFLHIAVADRYRLVIIISVALGIVFGTILSSFLVGFAIGSSSALIGYLTGRYIPDEYNPLIKSFNGAKVIVATQKHLFKPTFRAQ